MRKKDIELATVVILGGLFAWIWFTKSGRTLAQRAGSAVATGVENVSNLARGIRNNNPGNIRISGIAWQGKVADNTDGAFEQFATMSDGVRALGKNLLTYFDRHGLNTVRGIISRWAPASENMTGSYVNAVAGQMGIKPDDRINVRERNTLAMLAEAIIQHENGTGIAPGDLRSGIERALT